MIRLVKLPTLSTGSTAWVNPDEICSVVEYKTMVRVDDKVTDLVNVSINTSNGGQLKIENTTAMAIIKLLKINFGGK